MPQALFLMTDTALLDKVRNGRLRTLLGSDRCDAEIVEELVPRHPLAAPDERRTRRRPRASPGRPRPARARWPTSLWALINTREFVLNH